MSFDGSIFSSSDPIALLEEKAASSQGDHLVHLALGLLYISNGVSWDGEYHLLKSANLGNASAASFFVFHKTSLFHLMAQLKSCQTSEEAALLLFRSKSMQYADLPSLRKKLHHNAQRILEWAAPFSPLGSALSALGKVLAGERAALETLRELALQDQVEARIWYFLLTIEKGHTEEECKTLLKPFLKEAWAQRWIGTHLIKSDIESAIQWLWMAIEAGDEHSMKQMVHILEEIPEWNTVQFRIIAGLMEKNCPEVFSVLAKRQTELYSNLKRDYLETATSLGMDVSSQQAHTRSMRVSHVLVLLAFSIVCFLTTDLPDFFSVISVFIWGWYYYKAQKADADFSQKFDNLSSEALPKPIALEPYRIKAKESALFNRQPQAWEAYELGDENDFAINETDRKEAPFKFWDLDKLKEWDRAWIVDPKVPWHEIWSEFDIESCCFALSGASNEVKDRALSALSTQNRALKTKKMKLLGYLPLSLCLPHIHNIQSFTL